MRAAKPERLAAVLDLLRRKARPLTGAEVSAAFRDGDQTAAFAGATCPARPTPRGGGDLWTYPGHADILRDPLSRVKCPAGGFGHRGVSLHTESLSPNRSNFSTEFAVDKVSGAW